MAGAGAIPWSAILSYGQFKGLEPDVLEAFIHIIMGMDATWLAWQADELDGKRKELSKNRGKDL